MRHLFVSPLASAFGEVLHGLRLARAVCQAGDEVIFLAPSRLHALVATAPVTFGRIDLALPELDRQVRALLRRLRCDTLVLVDAAAVGKAAGALRLDLSAFTEPGVPVIALDCWNLPAAPRVWDYGTHEETLPAALHELPLRLTPVPVAPLGAPGAFDAVPALTPPAASEREAVRAGLGVGQNERLVVWPSASWQHAENHADPMLARLCSRLPQVVLPRLARLGRGVHVVHVGPAPFPGGGALAPGYRFAGQLEPAQFERLLGAADLFLGFNAVASSLATALALGVPTLLGISEQMRAWPLRLSRFLAPLVTENPFYATTRIVDPLDDDAYTEACRALLFDEDVAATLREAQSAYRREVARLPGAGARFASLCALAQPACR